MSMNVTNSISLLFRWPLLSHSWIQVCFLQLLFFEVRQKSKESHGCLLEICNLIIFHSDRREFVRFCGLFFFFWSVALDSLGKLVNTPNLLSPSLSVSKALLLWLCANVNRCIKETSICYVASLRGSSWLLHFSYFSPFEDSILISWCLEQIQIHFSSCSLASFATRPRLVSIFSLFLKHRPAAQNANV